MVYYHQIQGKMDFVDFGGMVHVYKYSCVCWLSHLTVIITEYQSGSNECAYSMQLCSLSTWS